MKQTKFANFNCSVPIITVSDICSFQVECFFQDLYMESILEHFRNSFFNQDFKMDPVRPKFGSWWGEIRITPDYRDGTTWDLEWRYLGLTTDGSFW